MGGKLTRVNFKKVLRPLWKNIGKLGSRNSPRLVKGKFLDIGYLEKLRF